MIHRVVVDTSLLVTLLIEPAGTGQAISARLSGTRLHAPDHVSVEFVNALRRLNRTGVLGDTEARIALDGFWALTVQRWPLEALSPRVWQLGSNLTAYDAAYVALAEQLQVPLLTADARLARAPGPTCPIEVFG